MSRMYGKWFEVNNKKEASKFAKDNGLRLWSVILRADRNKTAQSRIFYAGAELPASMGKDIATGKTKVEELGGTGHAATSPASTPASSSSRQEGASAGAPPARRRGRPPKTLYPVVVPPRQPRGRKREALGGSPLRKPPRVQQEAAAVPSSSPSPAPSSLPLPVAAFSGEISADEFATLIADKVVTSLLAMIQEIPSPSWEKAKAAVSLTETEQVEEVVDAQSEDVLPLAQEVPERDEREFLVQEDAPAGDVLDKAALTDAEGYVGDAAGDNDDPEGADGADEAEFEKWDTGDSTTEGTDGGTP